jgi:hypothetical protein
MNKGYNEYFAVIAAILLAAVLASGCSTPAQTGNLRDQDSAPISYVTPTSASTQTPAQSYYQCMNVLTQYGLQQQCYQVSNANTNSYAQYTYSKLGFAKSVSEESKQVAYAAYLSAIDKSAAADMKAQYDALIARYSN